MNEPSEDTLLILEVLRRVAAETLERKRRLGQYAVVWKDGKPMMIGTGMDKTPAIGSSTQAWIVEDAMIPKKANGQKGLAMIDSTKGRIDPDTRLAVEMFRNQLAGRYPVQVTVLFGSRARKDHRPESDADLAVLLGGEPGSRVDVALDLADIAFDIMLETGILIEPIPFWQDEWEHPEHFTNPALIENIRHHGVRL